MANNRKISGYLIDPDYQGKFLLIFGSFGFIQTLFFFYALTSVFEQIESVTAAQDLEKVEILTQLDILQSNMYFIFGGAFLLLLILFLIVSFRFTHKTAGALYQFRKTFEEIESSGELKKIKLRDGDFFREVENVFNKMIDKIK